MTDDSPVTRQDQQALPPQSHDSTLEPTPLARPGARFATSANPSSASGSGTSTPSTIPIPVTQRDRDHDRDDHSRSPSSIRKTGSTAVSISPERGHGHALELDSFLALHSTLANTITNSGARSSVEFLQTQAQTPTDEREEDLLDAVDGVYLGGTALSHTRTAPQPSTATAVEQEELPSPMRLSFDRSPNSTDQAARTQSRHPASSRPARQRAATTTITPRLFSKSPLPRAASRPQTSSSSPAPQSSLQSHLYNGLLNATLSDLHIVAFGHLYRLHRIVLAGQSGFFTSLLSGGFSEEQSSSASPFTIRRGNASIEAIAIELPYPMTRAAFEFSIAKLYGGGPELAPPPWANASFAHPLSEAYERLSLHALSSNNTSSRLPVPSVIADWAKVAPSDHSDRHQQYQPATPAFLLSLLATATYLEIPDVAQLAVEVIQNTMTPWTVGRYLAFAFGESVGASETEMQDEGEACRGLEGVGQPLGDESTPHMTPQPTTPKSYASSFASAAEGDTSVFVGPEGERVGEACACWLAKWGSDVLRIEEWLASLSVAERSAAVDSIFFDSTSSSSTSASIPAALRPPPLRLWSSLPGGLSSRWVRGLISSDAFFVPTKAESPGGDETGVGYSGLGSDGEFERYLFAKRAVLLRRRERLLGSDRRAKAKEHVEALAAGTSGISLGSSEEEGEDDGAKCGGERRSFEDTGTEDGGDDDDADGVDDDDDDSEPSCDPDEAEYRELFATGVRYTHLTFRQLQYISHDACPVTGLSFVPQSVIERAFWQSERFKCQLPIVVQNRYISHHIYGSGTRTPGGGEAQQVEELPELGLTAGINSKLNEKRYGSARQPFWLVPVDDTTRINDRMSSSATGADNNGEPLPSESSPSSPSSSPRKTSSLPQGAEGFFGLAVETRMGTQQGAQSAVFGSAAEEQLGRRFVAHEPFRISLEFHSVASLKDKQRLYSSTFFHAGSFFNAYLQRIQRKGSQQLGIYLHRQTPAEPFPHPSQPPPPAGASPSLLSEVFRSRASPSVVGSLAPYTDRRKSIQAFFSIWCPNVMGNSLTRFSSGPDSFALSQSWGWKSTSLSSEFLMATTALPEPGRLSSLRVTIVMGLV